MVVLRLFVKISYSWSAATPVTFKVLHVVFGKRGDILFVCIHTSVILRKKTEIIERHDDMTDLLASQHRFIHR